MRTRKNENRDAARKSYAKPAVEKNGNLKEVTEGDVAGLTGGGVGGPNDNQFDFTRE